MISIPNPDFLMPVRHGERLFTFPFSGTELVKLDLLCEAGSAFQSMKLSAAAANKLMMVATQGMNSAELSEFFDFRGILIESNSDVLQASTTFYFLRRYADELLPIVYDIVSRPAFNNDDFEVWRARRKKKIMHLEQKTDAMARRMFYGSLFDENHPLGRFASAADADSLTLDTVKSFHHNRYSPEKMTVVVAGNVDDTLVGKIDEMFTKDGDAVQLMPLAQEREVSGQRLEKKMDGATQVSLRIGRLLPLAWDSMDYARFMLLTTVLGGYFGSRLMSNIREDKGYTYGINARTQIYRGIIIFYIVADVAAETANDAVDEVWRELERLRNEPIPESELELVKTVMAGDFLRSVDGIFERSARFCDMYGTCVDESLTLNLRKAINETTAAQLQELAQRLLCPETMVCCLAGNLR